MKLFTIGCSFTEGQGLQKQASECYPHLLSKKLELQYFNFGATGMSNDYIFRKVFELINSNTLIKDDILIIQWTHYLRKELPVSHDKYQWYHVVPNSFHAYDDKVIIERDDDSKSVQNMYIDGELSESRLIEKEELQSNNQPLLENYILHFLNETYQKNTTKNYINALYTYLEYFGYKHIHFFGWDACNIKSVFDNKSNFLKESFGAYTKTQGNEHPNKKAHSVWSDFLYKKILEFEYLNTFENQLENYRKNLYKLKSEIEKDIEDANQKIINESELKLEKEIKKIRKQKELELQKQIEEDANRLNVLKEEIKNEIEKQHQTLKVIRKPKTLI
jgi:hypothetical protein